ncbi:MAG: HDIG domain-containing protein [Clostridia bacterium]|nr:HDIG domain-containing protein [Clostridia bacterium]
MKTSRRIICIAILVITTFVIGFSLLHNSISTQYDVSPGAVCPEDIYATRNITDSVTTQARRDAAANAVSEVYVVDSALTTSSVSEAADFISDLYDVLYDDSLLEKAQLLKLTSSIELDESLIEAAASLTDEQYELLSTVPSLIEEVMSSGVSDLEEGMNAFNNLLTENGFSAPVSSIAYAIAEDVICVNKTLNAEATESARTAAADAVSEVTYMKNQIIVRRGEIVTEAQYAMLKELGFVRGGSSVDVFHTISVIALLITSVALCLFYYFIVGRKKITSSPVTVTIICSFLSLCGAVLSYLSSTGSNEFLIYIMPLSLTPALISLLITPDMAFVVNLITALCAAVHTDNYTIGFVVAAAGVATSVFFSNVRSRSQLLPSTCFSALSYCLLYTAAYCDISKSITDIGHVFIYSLAGTIFGCILTIGTLPFWEAIFDVITPMKLSELSNPEHKLLKKLLLKAPGSYHHSLTVANMADAAAAAIGANSMLARVGAYYHDVGKMENPIYFKENQITAINPHDNMPPEESAAVIIRHVSDGAALAESYHLPRAVKDIIVQHHGTTTVSFFLYKAKEQNPDVDEKLFTYPGPTPVSKEASIVMLADACEAAVRAIREKGNDNVREIVDSIVSGRISAGQLNTSELTFSDLEKIKASFAETLDQYFHKRILYPQNKIKEPRQDG